MMLNVTSEAIEMASWFSAAMIASLLNEHSAVLELFASQWTDSPEDCVQDTVLELMRQTAPPNNLAAWLFHVVRLRAITAHRSATRRRHHEAIAARLVRVSTEHPEALFDVEELAIALNLLDDDVREVVIARTWGGLGFAEIALMSNTSTATAFRRYEAGLKTLRTRLEGLCEKNIPTTPISAPNCPMT